MIREGCKGEIVEAAETVRITPKDPSRDGDASAAVAQPVAACGESTQHVEILGVGGRESFQQRMSLGKQIDLDQKAGEVLAFVTGFLVRDPEQGLPQLPPGLVDASAADQGLRQTASNQGGLGVESSNDLELDPGVIESAHRERGDAEFPVGVEVRGFDLEHAAESIDRFGSAIEPDQEPAGGQEALDRGGVLTQFGEVELQGPLGATASGQEAGDAGTKARHSRGLSHRLPIAPAGAIVLADVGLQITHGHQVEGHLLEGLLGLEVDQLRVLGPAQSMKDRDPDRMTVFIDLSGGGGAFGEIKGLLESLETEAELGAGGKGSGISGKQGDRLAHRGEGLLGPIEGFEDAGQGGMPFTA